MKFIDSMRFKEWNDHSDSEDAKRELADLVRDRRMGIRPEDAEGTRDMGSDARDRFGLGAEEEEDKLEAARRMLDAHRSRSGT